MQRNFEQWRVLGLLVVCVLINYLDRGNLAVSASDLTRDLSLTPERMGILLSAFSWTYVVFVALAGWLLDRIDVYRLLGASFFLMCVATALTGLVHGFVPLLALRLAVGAGASVAFPAFSKILASDYLEEQRGRANSAIDAGTKVAPALGMIIGGLVIVRYGWRALFFILGIGAMAWIPLWFHWKPRVHVAQAKAAPLAKPPGMMELLGQRSVWGTFIGLYCLNSAWYFLITWFPYYLVRERHFSTERMAVLGSLPFWLLAASTSISGLAADSWILRGGSPTRVRKTFLVTGMLACTLLLPASVASDDHVAIGLFTLACFTFGMTTSNHWGVTQTLAGPAAAGKWTGIQNAFGNVAGITMPWITGVIVERTKSFHLAFVLVAVMVALGACSYGLVVGRVEPIRWKGMASGLILFLALAGACDLRAATYFTDCVRGRDSNPGTTQALAWKTLEKVASTEFRAGDRILLKSGCVWREALRPRSSGAEGAPIVIDRYGDGAMPRVDGAGVVEDAVLLHNVQHIEVRNLEVTNHGSEPAVRRGVHVWAENFGTARHIVISGLYIHDVNGTNQRKDNGGIIFRTTGGSTPTRFDGLTIERNVVWKVDRSAIAAQSSHAMRTRWFPSLHVEIRDNYVDDIGGDGIVPWATDGALVEYNVARNCNRRAGSYNAGIWPWSTDNSVFRFNEAAFTRTTLDGQGFDSDYNSRNTTFEYNYSHDNEGGFMLICSPGSRRAAENVGNVGTVVRRNISRNDAARIFNVSAVEQTRVEENAIYVAAGMDVQIVLLSDWSGWPDGLVFARNRFYVVGTGRYGHSASKRPDGTYELSAGWGPSKGIEFAGNRYYGHHVDPPRDAEGVQARVPAVVRDWDGPRFDPARPAEYGEFVRRHREWLLGLMRAEFGGVQ